MDFVIKRKKDWIKTGKRTLPEIKNEIEEKVKNISSAEIRMNELSAGGGFTGGGGGENYNPGAGFMNLLGIGSEKERSG